MINDSDPKNWHISGTSPLIAAGVTARIVPPQKVRAILYVWGGLQIISYRPMPGWWRRFWTKALLGWEWEPVENGDTENLG